jgi:hypothetical protein
VQACRLTNAQDLFLNIVDVWLRATLCYLTSICIKSRQTTFFNYSIDSTLLRDHTPAYITTPKVFLLKTENVPSFFSYWLSRDYFLLLCCFVLNRLQCLWVAFPICTQIAVNFYNQILNRTEISCIEMLLIQCQIKRMQRDVSTLKNFNAWRLPTK